MADDPTSPSDCVATALRPRADDERSQIRATHPYSFRSGQWARLVSVTSGPGRECYLVEFPDGVTDLWVVADPAAGYEFR